MNILLPKSTFLKMIEEHTFKFFIALLFIICLCTFIRSRHTSINSVWIHEKVTIWNEDKFTNSEFDSKNDFVVMDFNQWKKLSKLMDSPISIDVSRLKKAGEVSYFFSDKDIYFISHKRIDLSWKRDIFYEITAREFDTIDSVDLTIKERENIIALRDSLIIFLIGIAYWIIMLYCVLIYRVFSYGIKLLKKKTLKKGDA